MAEMTQGEGAYVLKDVFDARMDRMEMLLEKTLLEMKADNEKLRSEMKAENEKLRNEMTAEISGLHDKINQEVGGLRNEMKAEISGLHDKINQEVGGLRNEMKEEVSSLRTEIRVLDTRMDGLASRIDGVQTTVYWGFAILAIVIAFLPTIQDRLKGFHRPSFTLDDVQQRIDAAIAKALKPQALS